MQVKSPQEFEYTWDYYKVVKIMSGDEARRRSAYERASIFYCKVREKTKHSRAGMGGLDLRLSPACGS